MCYYCLLLITLLLSVPATAQKVRRVSADYTYTSSNPEETPKQAEQTAFLQARQQAIRSEFGERVTGQTDYIVSMGSGRESETFRQHSGTELKADWIETIKEEVRQMRYENGCWEVTVYVEGRAREISTAGVDFEYHILRNGSDVRHEEKHFKDRDRLSLMFKAPVDGYLAVYVVDDKVAYCLLPYPEQTDGVYRVSADRQYVFFSDKHRQPGEEYYNVVRRMYATLDAGTEVNEVYVIFSPVPFSKKTDRDGSIVDDELTLARNISADAFADWLATCRRRDSRMRVEVSTITIKK